MRTVDQKRRNAVIAAALGAALLFGGGTYALWTATADITGGEVKAGDLNIQAGSMAAYDVSSDTAGDVDIEVGTITLTDVPGKSIADLSAFRIVPGDKIALVFPYTVTLVGDNLKADLTVSIENSDATTFTFGKNLTLEYQRFDADGASMGVAAPMSASQSLGTLTEADDDTTIIFVLFITFNNVGDRIDVNEVLDLSNAITMTLTQSARS